MNSVQVNFQVNKHGQVGKWCTKCTPYHTIDDLAWFYRRGGHNTRYTYRAEVNGNAVGSNTMLKDSVNFNASPVESGIVLFVYEGDVDIEEPPIKFRCHGSVVDTFYFHLSDTVEHVRNEVLGDKQDYSMRLAHTGLLMRHAGLPLSVMLGDVNPLFDIDVEVSPAQLTNINYPVVNVVFEGPEITRFEAKLSTGFRIHQIQSVLEKHFGWRAILGLKGKHVDENTSLRELVDSEECTLSVDRHIEYTTQVEEVQYELSLNGKAIIIDSSECFVMDNGHDEPYLAVNSRGLKKIREEFGDMVQKNRSGPEAEIRPAIGNPFNPIQTADHAPEEDRVNFQEAVNRHETLVQLVILGLSSTILIAVYWHYLKWILAVVLLVHVPIITFSSTIVEHGERMANRLQNYPRVRFAVRTYTSLISTIHKGLAKVWDIFLSILVTRMYMHQRKVRMENVGAVMGLVYLIILTSADLIKDAILGVILFFLPMIQSTVQEKIHLWSHGEIKALFNDMSAEIKVLRDLLEKNGQSRDLSDEFYLFHEGGLGLENYEEYLREYQQMRVMIKELQARGRMMNN